MTKCKCTDMFKTFWLTNVEDQKSTVYCFGYTNNKNTMWGHKYGFIAWRLYLPLIDLDSYYSWSWLHTGPFLLKRTLHLLCFPPWANALYFPWVHIFKAESVNYYLDRSCPWFIYCRFLWGKWSYWLFLLLLQIAKSLWARGSPREIEIDTSRLYEQFGVKDSGHSSSTESTNHVEILLNAKIAHNFSEYWSYHEKHLTILLIIMLNYI